MPSEQACLLLVPQSQGERVPGWNAGWHRCPGSTRHTVLAQVPAQRLATLCACPCQELSAASQRVEEHKGKWPRPAFPAVPWSNHCSRLLSCVFAEHRHAACCCSGVWQHRQFTPCKALALKAEGGSHEVEPKKAMRSQDIWWENALPCSGLHIKGFPCAHLCGNYLLGCSWMKDCFI